MDSVKKGMYVWYRGGGKKDEVPSGDCDVRGEPGTFCADRLFNHLDKDGVADLHKFRDIGIFKVARLNRADIAVPLKFHVKHLPLTLELLLQSKVSGDSLKIDYTDKDH